MKLTPEAPASLENFGLLFIRSYGSGRPLRKGGVRLEHTEEEREETDETFSRSEQTAAALNKGWCTSL